MRKRGNDAQSIDGELDKANRPFADVGDGCGYLVLGVGGHTGLLDFVGSGRRRYLEPVDVDGGNISSFFGDDAIRPA